MISFMPLDEFIRIAGISEQSRFIVDYMKRLNCTQILVENDYIDKEYLIDYQKFYSRSFENHRRVTDRVHFFTDGITVEKLFSPEVSDEEVNALYLGFSVVNPIQVKEGVHTIGRTLFKCYSDKSNRHFVTIKENVSLYGRRLVLNTAPFISQDLAVGACATAAVWVVLNVASKNLGLEMQSMYDITENAHKVPGAIRMDGNIITESIRGFPSTGLDSHQICYYFQSLRLETDVLYMNGSARGRERSDYIKMAITSSLDCGIPVIACLNMMKDGKVKAYHAVAIVGYSEECGEITRLYVHDDQVGPFASIISENTDNESDGFKTWKYKYNSKSWGLEYNRIEMDHVIVPRYHKMRLSMTDVWGMLQFSRNKFGYSEDDVSMVSLRTISDYKADLLYRGLANKKILTEQFPKYVWVFRHNRDLVDMVIDATAPNVMKYTAIDLKSGAYLTKLVS